MEFLQFFKLFKKCSYWNCFILSISIYHMNCFAQEVEIIEPASASLDCTDQRSLCYDCDSRYEANCDDPFSETSQTKPGHRLCYGCCVKHVHRFANEERIVRSCSEKLVIRYFIPGCMDMGAKGVMCFCNGNFCNGELNHTAVTKENIFRVGFKM